MSNDNGFDDLVRKKLEQQEEEVSPFSWSAVEKELPQQVKRSAFLRKRYLVLLLLLVSVTGYYFAVKTNTDNTIVQNTADKNSTEVAVVSSTSSSQISTAIENATENKGETSSDKLNSASAPEQATANVNSTNAPEANENKSPAKPGSRGSNVSQQNASVKVTSVVASNNSSKGLQLGQSLTPSLISAIPTTTEIKEIDYLTALLDNNNEELLPIAPDGKQLPKVTLPPVKERKTIGLFIEGFYSPDFSNKKMTNNNADESYVRLRRNTERYFYSHSMGIRVGYNLTSHISLKAGYDYSEVQERLSYSYIPGTDEAIKMGLTVDSISGTLIDPLTNSSKDTIIGNYQVIGEVTVPNYYKYYNIPFIINYSIGKNKLKWSAGVGTFLNVGLKTKGSIINQDRVTRTNLAGNSGQNPYRSSVGMGASAELLMSYELRKNVSFMVGPHAKYYFGNISKNNAPLNEKFFNWGVLTGLKLLF